MGSRGFPASGEKTKGHAKATRRIVSTDGTDHPLSFNLPNGIFGKDSAGKSVPWHPRTKLWWGKLRKSPQARLFTTELDWEYLLDTAVAHHSYYSDPSPSKAAELRTRLKVIGTNPEDRARLHMDIEFDEADMSIGESSSQTAGNVTDFAEAAEAAEAKRKAREEREAARRAQQG